MASAVKASVRLPSIGLQVSYGENPPGGDSGIVFDELGVGDLGSKGQSTWTTQKQKHQKCRFRAFDNHTYPRWCPAAEGQAGETMFRLSRTTSAPELKGRKEGPLSKANASPLWIP